MGSALSSPSGVRGAAPAANAFWHILSLANASGDNDFGSDFTGHYPPENDNVHGGRGSKTPKPKRCRSILRHFSLIRH